MASTFSVRFEDRLAGHVCIDEDGLYRKITCRCTVPFGQVYRLWLFSDTERQNLGVLFPDGDGFSLERRIPTGKVSLEGAQFYLLTPDCPEPTRFVPVVEGEPFPYMTSLMHSRFALRDGVPGLLIPYTQ